ncbi:hypothetical protein ECDEC14A_4794 [Escherichia coli DEC14A]|nr:hypothetical protein ECDEC14A_4794 [Escherichia coli DEC14A]
MISNRAMSQALCDTPTVVSGLTVEFSALFFNAKSRLRIKL